MRRLGARDLTGKRGLYRARFDVGAPWDSPEFSGGAALVADKPTEKPKVESPSDEVQDSVLTELKDAEVEELSPLQAFDLLLRLKQRLSESKPD